MKIFGLRIMRESEYKNWYLWADKMMEENDRIADENARLREIEAEYIRLKEGAQNGR